METKHVRPVLVEIKDKITLNSIVNDPTFGLGIIIEKHGEECFYNTQLMNHKWLIVLIVVLNDF